MSGAGGWGSKWFEKERERGEASFSGGDGDEVHEARIEAGRVPDGRELHQVCPFSFSAIVLAIKIGSCRRFCDILLFFSSFEFRRSCFGRTEDSLSVNVMILVTT